MLNKKTKHRGKSGKWKTPREIAGIGNRPRLGSDFVPRASRSIKHDTFSCFPTHRIFSTSRSTFAGFTRKVEGFGKRYQTAITSSTRARTPESHKSTRCERKISITKHHERDAKCKKGLGTLGATVETLLGIRKHH